MTRFLEGVLYAHHFNTHHLIATLMNKPCEDKKKQAVHNERVCCLCTTAVEFVNTLKKPPLELYRLVIKDSARSNYIESVTQQQ